MIKQKNSKKIVYKHSVDTHTKHNYNIFFLIVSAVAFAVFLVITGFVVNKLLMIALALVLAYPVRKSFRVVRYYIACLVCVFLIWLLKELGTTVIPFVFSVIIAYTLEPIVSKLERRGLPRWLSALSVVLLAGGAVVAGAVFVFPMIVEQMQSVLSKAGDYATSVQEYISDGGLHDLLNTFGLPQDTVTSMVTKELLPKIELLISTLFDSLLKIFLSFSNIATHVLNIIVLPFLTFYFLKDFGKLKEKIFDISKQENEKIYYYLQRFDSVLKTYIIWQFSAACIVFVFSSISFSFFGLPYGILLAAIAGLLNPLPYFGTIFSLIVGASVILLVNTQGAVSQIIVLFATIMGVHFINAYLLEPNIAGQKIGMHPILMIFSVFIFHAIFGVFGMLVAVPVMSVFTFAIQEAIRDYLTNKKEKNRFKST